MIATEFHVHEPRHALGGRGITIEVGSLHQRGRTVSDPDDADPYFAQAHPQKPSSDVSCSTRVACPARRSGRSLAERPPLRLLLAFALVLLLIGPRVVVDIPLG